MAGEDGDTSRGGLLSAIQNGVRQLGLIAQALGKIFPVISGTSGTAVAGSATLPANPVGFIVTTLPDGTSVKVPYYS